MNIIATFSSVIDAVISALYKSSNTAGGAITSSVAGDTAPSAAIDAEPSAVTISTITYELDSYVTSIADISIIFSAVVGTESSAVCRIISYTIFNNKLQVDACLHIIDHRSVLYLIFP